MDYEIEEFDPFIFVIKQNGIRLRIFARWYDGSEHSKAVLENAISGRCNPFAKWLSKFNLEFLGVSPLTAEYFPSTEVVDPPEVVALLAWLANDGVKGHWDSSRAGCKAWKLPFDELHEDTYTLLGSQELTLLPEEYIREYLLNEFNILPSDNISLARLKCLLEGTDQGELAVGEYEANPDFTSVKFRTKSGEKYRFEFKVKQAIVVKELASSVDPLGELDSDLLALIPSLGEMRHLFKGHPAWGTFIVETSRDPLRRKLDAIGRNPG